MKNQNLCRESHQRFGRCRETTFPNRNLLVICWTPWEDHVLNRRNLIVAFTDRTDFLQSVDVGSIAELGHELSERRWKRTAKRSLSLFQILVRRQRVSLVLASFERRKQFCNRHPASLS